eukprot:scaffold1777_cov19-Tisochrysis_lutea.AAC.1
MFLKLRKLLDIGGFPLKPLTCSLAQWAGGIPSLKISNVSPSMVRVLSALPSKSSLLTSTVGRQPSLPYPSLTSLLSVSMLAGTASWRYPLLKSEHVQRSHSEQAASPPFKRSGQTASPPWNSHVQISVNAQRAGGIPNFTFVAAPPQSAPTAAPASGGAASAPRDVPPSTASAAAGGASPSTASAAGVCLRSRLIVRVRVDLVVHG